MSSSGTTTSRSSSRKPASTSSIGLPPETKRPISSSGPSGRRERDALKRLGDEALEPLDREREVRAALRARDSVHFVEDQEADAPEDLRAREVSIKKSDSGVVIRMSGGVRSTKPRLLQARVARSDCHRELEPMPASGPRRLRSTS